MAAGCSLDLPKLQYVRLPHSAFVNVKTLEVSDVNSEIQFFDEHDALWEDDWPMQSLVVSALKGTYQNHSCVLNTAGHPKRYITIDLQEIVKLYPSLFHKRS